MSVRRGCQQSLHVVEREWRIDEETQHASTYEIPKRNSQEELERHLVSFDPRCIPFGTPVVVSVKRDESQRYDLESGKDRTKGEHGLWSASEVQVMKRA